MDADRNLYLSTDGPFKIHAVRPVDCPLGQIVFAGTKWNSQATYAHAPPPDYMRPTPHFLLVYTLEGEADYLDDSGLKAVLKKGSLVWSRPGVNQSYGPRRGSRWSEFFMWFSGPVFDAWDGCGFPGGRSRLLCLEPLDYWIGRFKEIVEPPAAQADGDPLVRLCLLQSLLAEAMKISSSSGREGSGSLPWRMKACKLLSEGTLNEPSLESIAKELGMSYTLFRKKFLRLSGKPPGKFRSGELMKRACARLMETDAALYEIAGDLGFRDQFHFSKSFKREIGIPPSEFRRQVLSRHS